MVPKRDANSQHKKAIRKPMHQQHCLLPILHAGCCMHGFEVESGKQAGEANCSSILGGARCSSPCCEHPHSEPVITHSEI